MGVYYGMILLGPPLAPMVGGWLATYASWRLIQLGIALVGLIVFIMVVLFLPETSHPGTTGIEKLRMAESLEGSPSVQKNRTGWRFVSLNPFGILLLLKNPIIVFVSLSGAFALVANYVAVVPLSYTLGPRYGLNSPALIGLCFLPSGIGGIAGSLMAGRLADIAIIRGRRRRQGKWIPEDRLLVTIPAVLFLMPCALITLALTITFVPGKIGLIISLVCLFFNGIGYEGVLATCSTYLVDLFHSQGAEVMAVAVAIRHGLSAIASGIVLPLVHEVGIIATNTLTALLVWVACALLYITIMNGETMRAWIDMDYTTVQDV